MINIIKKSNCSGCGVCVSVCPKQAISMQLDEEGFLYPKINKDLCIDCSLCNKFCPKENKFEKNKNYSCEFFAAYNKNKQIAIDSSSGGIFWSFVEYIIKNNGVVYGVELGKNFNVFHSRATTLNDALKFRKSKYLESNTNNIYKKVKEDLKNDRLVLFSGTPCQIAGLYCFLGKEYEKLYTCDVVCHGVPSKKVFNKYIAELNSKENSNAISMCWRDKENAGWGPNHVSINFENGKKLTSTSLDNPYQKGFLLNFYLRPSCYVCNWAKLPRVGDISLADFWGYTGELLEQNKNSGISVIVVSSRKGKDLFEKCNNSFIYHSVSKEYVISKSRHVYKHPKFRFARKYFFKDLEKYSFDFISKKYLYSNQKNFKNLIFKIIDKIVDKIC